jgi:hypothetical protein
MLHYLPATQSEQEKAPETCLSLGGFRTQNHMEFLGNSIMEPNEDVDALKFHIFKKFDLIFTAVNSITYQGVSKSFRTE